MSARQQRLALLALLLLAPVPSLAVWLGLYAYPGQPRGQLGYLLCKLWLVLFPLLWFWFVDAGHRRFRLRQLGWPRWRGLGAGLISGLGVAVIVLAAFRWLAAAAVDESLLRELLRRGGIGSPAGFLAFAVYWTALNSLSEELVWRWFVLGKLCLLSPPALAAGLSAGGFTAHHVIATWHYLSLPWLLLVSLAVFVAGALWAWMTLRYRTLWPAYLSHLIADAAIFAAAYRLLYTAPG